ncbi:MAG: hypothetical protein ACSHW0_00550 [Thalassotalea sp.]
MPTPKQQVTALCKQVASEQGWKYVSGRFTQKISKDASFIINPCFNYTSVSTSFLLNVKVKLPKIMKMVDSVSHLNLLQGIKMSGTIFEQPKALNLNILTTNRAFYFAGQHMTSETLMKQEITRWLVQGGNHLKETWPVEDYSALFEVMKNTPNCYAGLYGTSLLCLAAYLGKFDFIAQYYAGELAITQTLGKKRTATDENLLAALPDWQAQWQATGTIKL